MGKFLAGFLTGAVATVVTALVVADVETRRTRGMSFADYLRQAADERERDDHRGWRTSPRDAYAG